MAAREILKKGEKVCILHTILCLIDVIIVLQQQNRRDSSFPHSFFVAQLYADFCCCFSFFQVHHVDMHAKTDTLLRESIQEYDK